MFKKYQHVERLHNLEVKRITDGLCYVFPKLDGTNASVWWDKDFGIQAGSRKRTLELDADNAGFYAWVLESAAVRSFFIEHPTLRLYGEWLVPHSLKTYVDSAWRNFYVFDVMDENEKYLPYDKYKELLDKYGIDYIAPICIINNPSDDILYECINKNDYLIQDGKGVGEGIVIKNYNFVNRHGRTIWTKIVNAEFKVKHKKEMGYNELKEKSHIEKKVVDKYVNTTMVEKEYSKIAIEGWENKMIARLLHTVYYTLIKEESWDFIKEYKNPTIDYKYLMRLTYAKVKELKPELF